MTILNHEALRERINNLGTFNGLAMVLVDLAPAATPTEARLTLHFHNGNELTSILNDITADPVQAKAIFPIRGGHRIVAGSLGDRVQVVSVTDDPANTNVLHLMIRPIGDYSTYSLGVVYQNMDPLLSELNFKFRPGCFNNCPPDWDAPPALKEEPIIDYLAKDYDSFRHTLMAWMMQRVPGWEPTSEADLDQVLLELFSVAGDELSDYQDRVMNEAYLATARKRLSLARHARLIDYHIHQGNQASTHLVFTVSTPITLARGFQIATGNEPRASNIVVFMTNEVQAAHPLLNKMSLYTWQGAIPALAARSTSADLQLSSTTQAEAETVCNLIRDGKLIHLVIQEHKNPITGEQRGFDPTKRQVLRLLPGEAGADALEDPVTGDWFVRVRWRNEDQLKTNYCFTVDCPQPRGKVDEVSLFHGNLVKVYHGRPAQASFKDPGTPLGSEGEYHYERSKQGVVICRLPDSPIAYQNTPPGGETPPRSTLELTVDGDPWNEVISLIHSDDSAEGGDHFVIETDELGRSLVRMGNGVNGRKLPEGAEVHCTYQIGEGLEGNIGADVLTFFDTAAFPEIDTAWNPFDVTSGRAPEPVAEIIRRVPEAYRFRQLRAVTLNDYEKRAAELPEVSKASARYMWTGSWRTVCITIDPMGATTLDEALENKVANHLEAVRLLGEDLEIRPSRFVPLEIVVSVCIQPCYWPEDVKVVLEQLFSEGYTPDGRKAFFHPDHWTFGQALRASRIIGQVQAVPGVDHVTKVTLKRVGEATPDTTDIIEVRPNEIVQVRNDPDHMEEGSLRFEVKGGRR